MKRFVVVVFGCVLLAACATRPTAPAPRIEAPPQGEPAGTTGLNEAQLKVAFGQPAFVRHDGNAQIWRFDGATCKAFFFLYSRDGKTAVWHVETTPRGRTIAADEACLNALRRVPVPPPPPYS